MDGDFALVGGEEFRNGCEDMDREIMRASGGSPSTVLIIPTAAVTGPAKAANDGVTHFRSLGADASQLMVLDGSQANNAEFVAPARSASVIYFTGGSPDHLLSTLKDSILLRAIMEAVADGAVLAGSSAGAMVMGSLMRRPQSGGWVEGLDIVHSVAVLPHHERSDPAETSRQLQSQAPKDITVLGIDARSGCIGRPGRWRAVGVGKITVSYDAASGSLVVLDVRTGEVLAIVNQPTYNPNDRSQYSAERYRNRAITDIFEPGSSIKPLVVAAALESGQYRPSSIIDTAPGFVTVGAKTIEDGRNLGRISLTTILARSSNVGVTKLAMSLPPDQLWSTMTGFGLGELTASGFPGESAGLLTHYTHWQDISQATLGYGYGVSVTPLQLAQAYAALGDRGRTHPISLVAIDQPNGSKQIIAPETANAVKRMLEEVVRPGATGAKAGVTGYRIAGKTGTAWKSGIGGYSEDKYFSIFAGLAPASEPRLAAVVVIDEPRGELYYGSDVAAPVFAEVMSEALRLLAIPPDALPKRDAGDLIQGMTARATAQDDSR